MPITDMPILSMLRTKMQWHQERQRVLAENVANADTPNFRPSDLALPDFERPENNSAVTLARTSLRHIVSDTEQSNSFQPARGSHFQVRPGGNAVSVEDEMMKVAGNQMDYQAATELYARSLKLIKTAIGKS